MSDLCKDMTSTVHKLVKSTPIRKLLDEARFEVESCQQGIRGVIDGEDQGEPRHIIATFVEMALENRKFFIY